MQCSYKVHISSQKFVRNGVRPIRILQTFLLEIFKSIFVPTQSALPSRRCPQAFPSLKEAF